MRILVAGSNGQVGWEVVRLCPPAWTVHATDRTQLDISDPASIPRVVRELRPQVIVNATGYTTVDRAESEPAVARLINAEAVAVLAAEARACGATLVHYSTDYVFSGRKTTPYSPGDAPDPQSVYGATKLEGERAIIDSGASYVILRTQWVYGLRGRNFVLAILRQAALRPELRIVSDQTGAPTWARSIARATIGILSRGVPGHEGVYHLACAGSTTWFDFARAVFDEAATNIPGLTVPRILPVSSAEYGATAVRPAHAVLDCSATELTFGVTMPHWRDALREAMTDRAMLLAAIGAQPSMAAAASTAQTTVK